MPRVNEEDEKHFFHPIALKFWICLMFLPPKIMDVIQTISLYLKRIIWLNKESVKLFFDWLDMMRLIGWDLFSLSNLSHLNNDNFHFVPEHFTFSV